MLILCLIGLQSVFAQSREVSGIVTSAENGMSIPGVSVMVKGTTIGISTDIDGKYTISVPADGKILVFSSVGMKKIEASITSNVLNMVMESESVGMDEVVVVGYGTRKRNELTSSITTVNSDVLENVPMPSVEQVLQGNVAGLSSTSISGQPGAAQQIRIRGIGSINASNSPLYVIDGVPVVSGDYSTVSTSGNALAGISSNDIENISVLKDASATSIYGARGANGVILITTKSGKHGKTQFNFSAEYGVNELAVDGPKSLNSAQWKELNIESMKNYSPYAGYHDGTDEGVWGFLTTYFNDDWDGKTDTNWGKEVLRDVARQQQYNFSMRGGNKKTSFFASAGYFQQEGIVNNSDFDRITGLLNLTHRPSDKLTFKTSINISTSNQKSLVNGGAFANPMLSRFFLLPIDSPRNEDGTAKDLSGQGGRFGNGLFNPVYLQENDYQKTKTTKVFGTAQMEYKPMDGMKLTSKFGGDYMNLEEQSYQNPIHGDGRGRDGSASAAMGRNFNMVWQNMLDYGFTMNDDHRFDFKLLYEVQKNNYYRVNAYAERVASLGLEHLVSFSKPVTANSTGSSWTSASAMFNMNYGLKRKYFFDATFRREGSSVFSDKNKYGNFWSVGASWLITGEDFMKDVDFVSSLKLRSSYGSNGNSGIGSALYLSRTGYADAYNDYPVIYYLGVENQNLTWEKSTPFNVGLDFGLFNERVTGTVEYYNKTTKDMLLDVPLSFTTGHSSIKRNIGEMVNSGLELTLNTVNVKTDDFEWSTSFNITKQNNEVTKLDRDPNTGEYLDIVSGTKKIKVGSHIRTYYLRKWAGVDAANGDPLWYLNGKDGETTNDYSAAKRAEQGQSVPDIFGGITNNFSYKGFSLSFQLNYALGYKVYDSWAKYQQSDGAYIGSYNGYAKHLDRWQTPGQKTDVPKLVFGGNHDSNESSTRFLYDGDHIRLRSLTFGYNLPSNLLKKVGLSGCNIYVRGTNLLTYTFDKDLDFDPETGDTGIISLDLPQMKTISFGIKVNL